MVTLNTLSVLQLTSQDLTSQKTWNSMLTVTGFFDIIRNCLHLMNNMNITRNLNMAKKTLDKVDKSKTETFGLLCCETGPLSLAYNINKTGFVLFY